MLTPMFACIKTIANVNVRFLYCQHFKKKCMDSISNNNIFFKKYVPRCYTSGTGQLKFTEKHEWIKTENEIATVGITDHAQESLGEIVYIQLPEQGTEFKQLDECGALESVKAASEIYSPVSGKIMEINSELERMPNLINSSPMEKGWIFKIELKQPSELNNLFSEEEYKNFLKKGS